MILVARRVILSALIAASLAGCMHSPPPNQRYPIYFQKWSAQLDNSAKDIIASAAQLAAKDPSTPIFVVGYADPEGTPQANKDLSGTRAQVVVDGLIADGVTPERITKHAAGEVQYELDSLESRRVEIVVGKE